MFKSGLTVIFKLLSCMKTVLTKWYALYVTDKPSSLLIYAQHACHLPVYGAPTTSALQRTLFIAQAWHILCQAVIYLSSLYSVTRFCWSKTSYQASFCSPVILSSHWKQCNDGMHDLLQYHLLHFQHFLKAHDSLTALEACPLPFSSWIS